MLGCAAVSDTKDESVGFRKTPVTLDENLLCRPNTNPLVSLIDRRLDVSHFREQHWEGTFWEYLDLVAREPGRGATPFSASTT